MNTLKKLSKVLSLTGETLVALLGAVNDIGPSKVYRKAFGGVPLEELRRDREFYDERKRRRAEYFRMKRLEGQRLVQLRREGNDLWYKLTEIGYKEALKLKIISKQGELPEDEYCVVVFDVPEDIRHVRRALRVLLKKARFRMLQRSVWESDRDVVYELNEFVKLLNAEKFVTVYRATRMR
ncbi:MAG: CRISPR-associated endonuclease Cas2 [Candidatus Uhrbacteria bacterium]|nr:CRISPR-associated endonuclease Cas2 [Candidatus Uhrbacteria bacterium]